MNKKVLIPIIFSFILILSQLPSYASSVTELGVEPDSIKDQRALVLLLIDQEIMQYNSMATKIDRYAEDITRSIQVSVEQIQINTSWNENQIRSILQEKFIENGLVGGVLIGNITTPFYEHYPTVYPYQDLDDRYGADIWIGIIRPPIQGTASIELLETYFDRNHAFHSKTQVFNRECILASTYESEKKLIERIQRSGRWDAHFTLGNHSDTAFWKTQYLNLLSTNAEVLHVHGHGGPIHHDPNIWYTDIQKHPPQAAVVYLQTCNTGNFNKTNYIGGWYLFSGNTLAVISHSSPVWGFKGSGWGEGDNTVHLLSLAGGSLLGEAVLSSHPLQETMVILGDPTIAFSKTSPQKDQLFTLDIGNIVIGRTNTSIEESWYTDHILSADFNNDDAIDVIIDNVLYSNTGIDTHQMFTQKTLNISGMRPCAVDIDYDDDMDIVTAGDFIRIYVNEGHGIFDLDSVIKGKKTKAVVADDFDGDGDVDIIASNENGSIFYFEKVDTVYTIDFLTNVSWQPYALISLDSDNDGDKDVVIGDRAGFLHFFENHGNATFTKTTEHFGGYFYHGLSTGDFDNDGDTDLFLNGVFCDHKILSNRGDGTFQASDSIDAFSDTFLCLGVASDDFDNDGDIDILITHYDGIHFKENRYGFENSPPENLRIDGPAKGKKGKQYDYRVSATDLDAETIFYYLTWGDGSDDWIGPVSSSQEITISHIWDEKGNYLITAKAYDEFFYESDMVTIQMNMPKIMVFKDVLFRLIHQKLYDFPFLDFFSYRLLNLKIIN